MNLRRTLVGNLLDGTQVDEVDEVVEYFRKQEDSELCARASYTHYLT